MTLFCMCRASDTRATPSIFACLLNHFSGQSAKFLIWFCRSFGSLLAHRAGLADTPQR